MSCPIVQLGPLVFIIAVALAAAVMLALVYRALTRNAVPDIDDFDEHDFDHCTLPPTERRR